MARAFAGAAAGCGACGLSLRRSACECTWQAMSRTFSFRDASLASASRRFTVCTTVRSSSDEILLGDALHIVSGYLFDVFQPCEHDPPVAVHDFDRTASCEANPVLLSSWRIKTGAELWS